MENLVIILHVLAALAIIGLILMQQGKGAAMGASFGAGASQTVFGSQGSGNFFARATAVISALFFATSFGLAVIAKDKATVSDELGVPGLEESEVPAVEEEAAPAESDVPSVEEQAPVQSEIPSVDTPEDTAPTSEIPSVDETPATETEEETGSEEENSSTQP